MINNTPEFDQKRLKKMFEEQRDALQIINKTLHKLDNCNPIDKKPNVHKDIK